MADAVLAALYQEIILDHYRRPRNKGTLERPDAAVSLINPACDDVVEVELSFEGTRLENIRFSGRGCSISQASASIMTELVATRDIVEIERLYETFRAMIMGDAEAAAEPSLGSARALSGVAKYPARVKCALLAWNALDEGIRHYTNDT